MTDLLTIYPHIDAVFAINDPTALGVEEAARQAGRKDFFIVGVDGAPKVKERLRDADSLIVATLAQMPDNSIGHTPPTAANPALVSLWQAFERAIEIGYRCTREALRDPHAASGAQR